MGEISPSGERVGEEEERVGDLDEENEPLLVGGERERLLGDKLLEALLDASAAKELSKLARIGLHESFIRLILSSNPLEEDDDEMCEMLSGLVDRRPLLCATLLFPPRPFDAAAAAAAAALN